MPWPPRGVTPAERAAAVRRVRRLGNTAALAWLERQEPELTELLLEEAGRIHRQLVRHRLTPQQVRRLTRRIEHLGVTLVLAVRLARRVTPALPVPPDHPG